ncbi:MAG: nucleotidyltransferase family protein [Pseudomonadota bacterium]
MEMNDFIKSRRLEILRIAQKHGAVNVRIFGSYSRGEEGAGSDVDLLVDVAGDHSPWFPAGLTVDLEELLGKRVHVVTVPALHPHIRERVRQEAVPL